MGLSGEGAAVPVDEAARKRVAVETFVRNEASLRRTALRYSICDDDAEEALARGLEIVLNKAPSEDARELVRWTQTVVKHEALSVRAERERVLAGPAAATPEPGREDWVAMLPAEADGPAELAERHEAIERSREALTTLKPQELRALTLLAEGYSYREIGELTGFSTTKVNRCVAEGRERFRRFLVRREGGARCRELAPLLSAFADDEAAPAHVADLREHLATCPHCRATLRAYRAAPRAAAALAPVLPLPRGSIVDRLHDAYAAVATRVGGGGASDSTLGALAAGGGSRGAGMAALAKVLAVCAGTVGGAAACVATGVLPAPLIASPHHSTARPAAKVSHRPHHHRAEDAEAPATIEYETAPATESEAVSEPDPQPHESEASGGGKKSKSEGEEPPAEEPTSAYVSPPSESGATEYTEPAPTESTSSEYSSSSSSSPSPSTSSAPSSSSSAGTAAGEFGP